MYRLWGWGWEETEVRERSRQTSDRDRNAMINGSTHEKDKGFPNAFVPKNRTEKQIIVGDFNTILTKTHGRIPPKILKNVTASRILLTSYRI